MSVIENRSYFSYSKYTCLILLVLLGPVTFSQSITLNVSNTPLETVFHHIETQSQYRFVYGRETLAQSQPVTIKVTNVPLQRLLSEIFKNQPLSYSIDETYISVWRKPVLPADTATYYTIKGRIRNEKGEPVAGATLAVKGKNAATASADDGIFLLHNVDQQDVLTVTCIGYYTKEIVLRGKSFIDETLITAVDPMSETIVIAYGTTTRELNTGTIGKLSASQLEMLQAGSPLTALQGRIPGLNITQSSGLPGPNFSVLIRGRNSIQNGNAPLYIIDGIPFLSDADRLTQLSQINANNPLSSFGLTDIESIEVLKDADATAIYGSRGANGVVVITTQKASAAKNGLNVSFYTGWGKAPYTVDYMNTAQYLQMRREAFKNDQTTPTPANAPDLLLWDTTRYTDWKKLLIGGTARTFNTQFRFNQSSREISYAINAGYYKETTVFPGDAHMIRKTLNGSLRYQHPHHGLTASLQAGYSSNTSLLYQQDLASLLNTVPNAPPPFTASGSLNWSENGAAYTNPMSAVLKTYAVTTNRIAASGLITYTVGNLQIKSNLGFNSMAADEHYQTPIASQNPLLNPKGIAGFSSGASTNWITEPYIEYNDTFRKKLSAQFLIGTSWQQIKSGYTDTRATGYTDDRLLSTPEGAASVATFSNNYLYYRYQSWFARLKANWNRKYLLSASFRNDASSRFGPENRSAHFGSVGFGWIVSEEKFWPAQNTNSSFGKLKASFGSSGNDQIDNYQYLDSWSATTYPYDSVAGLYLSRIANPNFGWEQKKNLEAGLELGWHQNRFLLSATWFRSWCDRQIIRYALPYQTGISSVLKNVPAVVQNLGFEFELHTTIPLNKVKWESNVNITIAQNKLASFPAFIPSVYTGSLAEGKSLSTIKGYRYLGVDRQRGIYRFEDINKDGLFNTLDYTDIGHTDPLFYGGMQQVFRWKDFTLECFIQFVKQQGRDMIYGNSQRPGQMINQPSNLSQRWIVTGDLSPYQQYTQSPANPAFSAGGLISTSNAILTDASYLRLKNLMISYEPAEKWTRHINLRKVKLFAEAQNLLTLTPFKGPDPESQNRFTLPPLRTFVVGLQLNI